MEGGIGRGKEVRAELRACYGKMIEVDVSTGSFCVGKGVQDLPGLLGKRIEHCSLQNQCEPVCMQFRLHRTDWAGLF